MNAQTQFVCSGAGGIYLILLIYDLLLISIAIRPLHKRTFSNVMVIISKHTYLLFLGHT
jgi:hypothetical protein